MTSEYTPNYNLDLYASDDKPNLRDQYNAAMGKIDTQLKANADGVTNVSASVVAATTAANEAKQIAEAAAPEDHASATTNYGIGNSSEYGHVKLVDGWAYGSGSDATAGIAPSPKAIEGVISTQAAPQFHALNSALYGAASTSLYGHVKLTDLATSTSPATSGVAATPKCIDNKIDAFKGMFHAVDVLKQTNIQMNSPANGTCSLSIHFDPITNIVVVQFYLATFTGTFGSSSFNQVLYTLNSQYCPANDVVTTVYYDHGEQKMNLAVLRSGQIKLQVARSGISYSAPDMGACLTFIAEPDAV